MEWYQILGIPALVSGVALMIIGFIRDSIRFRRQKKKELSDEKRKEFINNTVAETLNELSKKIDTDNSYIREDLKTIHNDIQILKKGNQAGLRHNLLEIYKTWYVKGYCPQDIKDDFENQYQSYHNLGANGVMDVYREELLALPVVKPTKKKDE